MRFGEFISEEIVKGSKEVEIRVITDEERKWWGVNGEYLMTFKSGFAEPTLFLDVVKGRYITTTRDGVTVEMGNGMSGSNSLFFGGDDATDAIKKIQKILKSNGYKY